MQMKNTLIEKDDWYSFNQSISKLAEEYGARMDYLASSGVRCPSCEDLQVQLISRRAPAQWKCRSCGYKFEYEP